MNRSNIAVALIAAALSLGASASYAAGVENGNNYPEVAAQGQGLTRAEVIADLAKARAAGFLAQNDYDYPAVVQQGHALSRAQVQGDLAHARAAGEMNTNDHA